MSQSNPFNASHEAAETTVAGVDTPAAPATGRGFLATVADAIEIAAVPRLTGGRGYDVVIRVEGSFVDRNVPQVLARIAAQVQAEMELDGVNVTFRKVDARGATALVATVQ